MSKIVEYDLLNKNIDKEDINFAKLLIDLDKYKLTYWKNLYERKDKIPKEKFGNMRYYYLNINRMINRLEIPYINMVFYKRKIDEIPEEYRLVRFCEKSCYDDLYFLYFFEVIEMIFIIINKILVLTNDCLELGQDNKSNSNFEANILNAIKEKKDICDSLELKELMNYLSSYKGSIIEICKNDYRNLYVHDYTKEIPKYKEDDSGNVTYEYKLTVENSFDDVIKLLQELKIFLALIDKVINNVYFSNLI